MGVLRVGWVELGDEGNFLEIADLGQIEVGSELEVEKHLEKVSERENLKFGIS